MRVNKTDKAAAFERMREWLSPGDTVYTILRSVSRSGMQREIGLVLIKTDKDGGRATDLHPNWAASQILEYRQGKYDGLIVGECGMDMGFHLVYNLARSLWPDGFGCVGKGCLSNDHSNGDRDYTPHDPEAPATEEASARHHWHRDGGYALRHQWL